MHRSQPCRAPPQQLACRLCCSILSVTDIDGLVMDAAAESTTSEVTLTAAYLLTPFSSTVVEYSTLSTCTSVLKSAYAMQTARELRK